MWVLTQSELSGYRHTEKPPCEDKGRVHHQQAKGKPCNTLILAFSLQNGEKMNVYHFKTAVWGVLLWKP
jgi:hypothetical protein